MSNLLNSYYSNLNDLVSVHATDITSETATINSSLLVEYNGIQYNVGQALATAQSGTFVDLSSNQYISGQKEFGGTQVFSSLQLNSSLIVGSGATTLSNTTLGKIQYISGLTQDLNTDLNSLKAKTTQISYNPVGTLTTFTGSLSFPLSSIASTSINNTSFVNKTGAESIDGIKTFNSPPVMSGASITIGTIPVTRVNGTAITQSTANQVISSTKEFSVVQNFTSNIRLDGSLLVGAAGNVVLVNSTLQKIAFLANVTSDINATFNNYVLTTALNTALNPINTDISTLNTKTQYITSTLLNTTISDTLNLTNVVFSGNLNTIPASYFTGISANIQDSINDAISKANTSQNKADSAYNLASAAQGTASSAFALATTAQATGSGALALAGSAQASANTANSGLSTLSTQVDGIEVDVTELQVKCTQISHNSATSRTTISQTLNSPFLEIGNLTSGFTQTSTDQITLAGLLRCNNRVEINNTFELVNNNNIIVEGVINQDNATPPNNGVNQFLAPTNISNLTCNGINTNINSTNFNITSITNIKNISTSPLLSILLPISVTASRNLQGLLIGREQTLAQESNCNVGYNYIADGDFGNYGYLGLNVNTLNLKESFRWFSTGCSIPTGNLTISEGNLTVTAGNVSMPTGNLSLTNGDITLTNGEINLTSGDLNIVSGDAVLSNGNLTLGAGDIGVNNGDLNILNGELKTNTISKYSGTTLDINSNGIGSILNLNGPTVNIGYNQGLAAVNTINIGSTTSFSTINLNGLVVSAFGFNIGQVTQW